MKNLSQCLSMMTASCWINTVPRSVENAIRQQLTEMQIMAVERTPINGLYCITTRDNQFFSDATGRYLVVGELVPLKVCQDYLKPRFELSK